MQDLIIQNVPGSIPATNSGFSGFWGGVGGPTFLGPMVNGGTAGWVANQESAYLFFIAEAITVSKATLIITTTVASSTCSAGIYSSSGVKLVDTGAYSTTTLGVKTNNFSPVILPPAWYYFGWTVNSASVGVGYFQNFQTVNTCNILNANGTRLATAAATSNGIQNSSLGALAAANSGNVFSVPCVWFE